MVRHIVVCVKHKRHKNTESLEFLAGDCQNTHKIDHSGPYSRPSAEVSRHEHLHLRQPAQSPTREGAGQAQTSSTINRQARLQKLPPTTGRWTSCVIINRSFNEIRRISGRRSCSAAEAVNPDDRQARARGSSQPDPGNQAPRLSAISPVDLNNSILKANNRPARRLFSSSARHTNVIVCQLQR